MAALGVVLKISVEIVNAVCRFKGIPNLLFFKQE